MARRCGRSAGADELLQGPLDDLGARRTSQQVTDAFNTFFAAGDPSGLQAACIAALEHVAQRFADDPAVLGFELYNEPPVGEELVDAFSFAAAARVRAAAPDKLVLFEPTALRNLVDFAPKARGAVPGDERGLRAPRLHVRVRLRPDLADEPPAGRPRGERRRHAHRGHGLAHAARHRRVRHRPDPAERGSVDGPAGAAPRSLPRERRVLGVEGRLAGIVGRVRSARGRYVDRAPAGRRVDLAAARRADRRHRRRERVRLHDARAAPRDARRRARTRSTRPRATRSRATARHSRRRATQRPDSPRSRATACSMSRRDHGGYGPCHASTSTARCDASAIASAGASPRPSA